MTTIGNTSAISLPIDAGGDAFAVRRIYCVGRNYAAHAKEMGHLAPSDPDPVFFMKPADAIVQNGGTVPYPPATNDLHHEVELVVAVGDGGGVLGYAVGLDMTRRDLQAKAKKAGLPWDMAKGFDHSAPCSRIITRANVDDVEISLTVNGVVRQRARTRDMIWKVPQILDSLARLVSVRAGDLIFTGTPEGVGPVVRGDVLEGHVDGLEDLKITIV